MDGMDTIDSVWGARGNMSILPMILSDNGE